MAVVGRHVQHHAMLLADAAERGGGAASVTKWLISEMWPMRTGADRPYFKLSATRITRRLSSTIIRETFTSR